MNVNRSVGNIFLVDSKINSKVVGLAIAGTFLTALLKFVLEGQPVSNNFTLEDILAYPLIVAALLLFIIRIKLITKFSRDYIKFRLAFIFHLVFQMAILLFFLRIPSLYSYFAGLLFFISGVQRVIIQKTNALFFAEMSDFLSFIQLYGYVRAAFFGVVALVFAKIVSLSIPSVWFLFFLLIFIFELIFLSNLYPYCIKHKDIERTIAVLRTIANKPVVKIGELSSLANLSDETISKCVHRLSLGNFVDIQDNYVTLSKEGKKIYRNEW